MIGWIKERLDDSVLLSGLDQFGEMVLFGGKFFTRVFRRPLEGREIVRQMDEVGSKSFILVAVTGFAIGVVLAMQSRGTLARFGAEDLLPSMLGLAIFKEIGPVLTSLVLAGRLGAGIGAEIGSMRVTEQIDALEVAALKPYDYLVVTRIVACVVMFPLLTIMADMIAMSGGYLESVIASDQDYRVFFNSAFQSMNLPDLIVDTMKTSVFGFIVATVSCFKGFTVRGGTREVGQAAMQAVVLSSLFIFLADVIMVRLSLMFFPIA